MSQSNSSYGVKSPKGTARSQDEQHTNQSESTDDESVEPACRTRDVGRGVDRREWREMPYNARMRTFYEPCDWPACYPDGAPDESEIEMVVRSCRAPTVYHRPRDDEPNDETGGPETTANGTHPSQDAIERLGPISSLADLREGQRVLLQNWQHPLCVTDTASEPDGTVGLRGPEGGEYQVEGRPEFPQPYYLSKVGYVSEIVRVRVETPAEED
ncbi:hypothetical protein [Halococcus sp. AFM35]|uniref:hypothetical protein n=1 Tax=Halococcus sp. AFM35 TaxID=3421653 RepID=UPI003EB6F556